MDLEFDVNNQILTRVDNNKLVNKSRNYVQCNFSFITSDWEDLDKFAIFSSPKHNHYVVHLGTLMRGSAVVPSDVLLGDYFQVSVYGGDLLTTNRVKINLIKTGYTTHISSVKKFKTDVFVQIFKELDVKFDVAIFDGDSNVSFYNTDDEGELVELCNIDLNLHNLAHTGSYQDLEDVPEDIANVRNTISEEIRLSFTYLAGNILSYGN